MRVPRPLLTALLLLLLCLACGGKGEHASRPDAGGGTSGAAARVAAVPRPELGALAPPLARRLGRELEQAEATGADPERGAAEKAAAYGALGERLAAFDFLEAAEAALGNAAALDPEDSRWPHLLGLVGFERGRLAEAARSFERALELEGEPGPLRTALLLHLGTTYLELGRVEAAGELFEEVLAVEPDSAAAHARLGELARAAGDADRAARAYRRALELQPEADSLHYALAQAYRRQGETELAAEHLALRGEREVRWPDPRMQALADRINLTIVEVLLAEIAGGKGFDPVATLDFARSNLGHVEGTVEALRRELAAARQAAGGLDPRIEARFLYLLGGLLVHRGRDEAALEDFRAAIGLWGDFLEARLKLANALARTGRLKEAASEYGEVLRLDPAHPAALLRRGTLALELGRPAEALADLEAAVRAAPERRRPDARLRLAVALLLAGDREGFERERTALFAHELDPEQALRAHLNLASALARTGHRREAAEEFRACLRIRPDLPQALEGLAAL